MAKTKLELVKGSRSSTRNKKTAPNTRRIVFVPREDGTLICVEQDTYYSMKLLKVVLVTVDESAVGYEKLD